MQTFLLVILSLIFSSAFAQNQKIEDQIKYKATYELTYSPDSTNIQDLKSEDFNLYLGNKVSIFASMGRTMSDSLKMNLQGRDIGSMDFEERAKRTKTEFEGVIYKGFPEEKISYTYKIIRDQLRYEEDLSQFDWEILSENRTIQGYKVQKAATTFSGRDYIAWFTSEIPISDGPYKFNGLPGLIFEISDTENHYRYSLKSFEKLNNTDPVALETSNFIKSDKEEVLKRIKEYKLNPFAVLERNNTPDRKVTIGFKDGQKEKLLRDYKEKLEKQNNPIEQE
ncbi:GLPGLI family protein [Salegentibacter sp. LM13S]|uniref:GLPGLI family protein n=1 Tax=Salegentibacter lacus TaxID=2873599 RepID=UPI001CCD1776|nr:GLPGLI family protein [Salegentibacter lacus]MBZ9632376.1 GLPGLI family protein [Salegentibacter lacus]